MTLTDLKHEAEYLRDKHRRTANDERRLMEVESEIVEMEKTFGEIGGEDE